MTSKFSQSDTDRLAQTDEFFNSINLPSLSDSNKETCEAPITLDECKKAIDGLALDKTPGSDGFNLNFYSKLWSDIQILVFESFQYSYNSGNLSIDQKRGILSLNPKKGKDIRYLKHWRPLTLLNTD